MTKNSSRSISRAAAFAAARKAGARFVDSPAAGCVSLAEFERLARGKALPTGVAAWSFRRTDKRFVLYNKNGAQVGSAATRKTCP